MSREREPGVDDATGELTKRLYQLGKDNRRVTLFVGSGLSAPVVPSVSGMLAIADEYAGSQPDTAGLRGTLARARRDNAGDDLAIYRAYRRAFADWVSGNEFDLVVQAAVLRAYQPAAEGPPAPRRWQRVEAALGSEMERHKAGWVVPAGAAALGRVLAETSLFRHRAFTTCLDPLLEVAVARAGRRYRRFTTVPGQPIDVYRDPNGGDAVAIHHMHGYWRPDETAGPHQVTYDPDYLLDHRDELAQQLADSIDDHTLCVLAYSGWDGILAEAVRRIATKGRPLTILWAARSIDRDAVIAALQTQSGAPPTVDFYLGVDADLLLQRLADDMQVSSPAGTAIRDVRHPAWEREIISEPGTSPPRKALDLLRQLDSRYQWERSWSGEPTAPGLIFWPMRVRSSPTVINMVQALAAAALSAREVDIMICLDDFSVDDVEHSTERYKRDVLRWFALVPQSRQPVFASLREFISDREQSAPDRTSSHLLRPIRPWDVAREALGERNPPILDVLMAAKLIPDLPEDQLIQQADKIVTALISRKGRRLMMPFTVWSQLNYLLLEKPTRSIMTLGGKEERKLWQLWRFAFDHGVHQLYNPTIRSLTNQSLMLGWSSEDTLRRYLRDTMRESDWTEEGHYVRWLAQNAFLLPQYLSESDAPTFMDSVLDSWAAVREAINVHGEKAVDFLAEHVSSLYLG